MKLLMFLLLFISRTVCQAEIRVQELSNPKPSLIEIGKELEQFKTKNLKIVLWYFGQNGLRQEATSLYQNELFRPTFLSDFQFYLYDLTAWGQFGLVQPKPF